MARPATIDEVYGRSSWPLVVAASVPLGVPGVPFVGLGADIPTRFGAASSDERGGGGVLLVGAAAAVAAFWMMRRR